MLTLIIIAVILFTGIPLVIVVSLMKSEERQLDMHIQSLGASISTKAPPRQQSLKNKGLAIKGQQKKHTGKKARKQKGVEKTTIAKLQTQKSGTSDFKLTEYLEKMQNLGRMYLEKIKKISFNIRKRMPGHVYSSREEMLHHQATSRNKRPRT